MSKSTKPFLRILKYIDEYTMPELSDVEPKTGTAEQMIDRLVRIFGVRDYEPGAVVVELHDENGDLLDKSAIVPPSGAEWLLRDFFKMPAAWRAYRQKST